MLGLKAPLANKLALDTWIGHPAPILLVVEAQLISYRENGRIVE
jgi:hypothetical protein